MDNKEGRMGEERKGGREGGREGGMKEIERKRKRREERMPHIVCQHKSSSLNDKLVALLILHHGSSQASCTARLSRSVDRPGAEFLHLPGDVMTMSLECTTNPACRY